MNMKAKCCCEGGGGPCSIVLSVAADTSMGEFIQMDTAFDGIAGLPICMIDDLSIKALATGSVDFTIDNRSGAIAWVGGPYGIFRVKKNGATHVTMTSSDIVSHGGTWTFPIAVAVNDVLSIEVLATSISSTSTVADLTMSSPLYGSFSTCGDCPP